MPISVNQIFHHQGIDIKGSVQWGKPIENYCAGIYIVSTSPDPEKIENLSSEPKFDDFKILEWMSRANDMTIYGKKATLEGIKERLSQFWMPDENIYYIGQTSDQTLNKRTRQYYNQKIGKRSPHAGGFWLLTLTSLNDLYVHYGDCSDAKKHETSMQEHFMSQVTQETIALLKDKSLALPFANISYKGKNKKHGFKNHKI